MRVNLDLVKELRGEVMGKEESYKGKVTKYYNRKVKNK